MFADFKRFLQAEAKEKIVRFNIDMKRSQVHRRDVRDNEEE